MTENDESWCIVRLGEDYNWWVHESSDNVHCDVEYAGVLDPKQVERMGDLLEHLRQYGLNEDIVDSAFITYSIDKEVPKEMLRIKSTKESVLVPKGNIFCLPNISSDREGPFIDFLDHIMALRVKFLNDSLEFKQPLSVEEVEDILHIEQQERYISDVKTHVFDEIMSILDYMPDGYTLDDNDDDEMSSKKADDLDLSEFDDDIDESLNMDEEKYWQ